MKTTTLNINEKFLKQAQEICDATETSLEDHINAALCCYNTLRQKEIEKNLHNEKSKCGFENTMKILHEMEDIAMEDCCRK